MEVDDNLKDELDSFDASKYSDKLKEKQKKKEDSEEEKEKKPETKKSTRRSKRTPSKTQDKKENADSNDKDKPKSEDKKPSKTKFQQFVDFITKPIVSISLLVGLLSLLSVGGFHYGRISNYQNLTGIVQADYNGNFILSIDSTKETYYIQNVPEVLVGKDSLDCEKLLSTVIKEDSLSVFSIQVIGYLPLAGKKDSTDEVFKILGYNALSIHKTCDK